MPRFEVQCRFSVQVDDENAEKAMEKVEQDVSFISGDFVEVWQLQAEEI